MASSARRRSGGGPGKAQWVVLGGAVLVILGLTFALGLLVGRQWARQTQTASAVIATVSEPAKKPAAAPRRSGIAAETMADRAPESTETLTFYRTLTEPLDGPDAGSTLEPKPVAVKIPAAPPPPAPTVKAPAAAPALPAATAPSLPPAPGRTANGPSPWTVQVGAYKNRRQADESRQHLVAAGLDAYVVTLAAQEGQARFRVRVGTYRSREEAVATAERLRAQRSLTTFVTPK
ncbi:MAG: SPOR domain-containing protein [Candidatus Rokuibacteriota bacterium]